VDVDVGVGGVVEVETGGAVVSVARAALRGS
jgi:hypothetical protein